MDFLSAAGQIVQEMLKKWKESKMEVKFTHEGYISLLEAIYSAGYRVVGYQDWREVQKSCILRHDIDNDMHKALEIAQLEHDYTGGITRATYFVLLSSGFYNVMEKAPIPL